MVNVTNQKAATSPKKQQVPEPALVRELSNDRQSQGSTLSAKLSASLKKVIQNSANKQSTSAAIKMQEILRRQQEGKGSGSKAAASNADGNKAGSVGPFSPVAKSTGKATADSSGKILANTTRNVRASTSQERMLELSTIKEGRKSTSTLPKSAIKPNNDANMTLGVNDSIDIHNRTFQVDISN